jgi:hypothetical protein
MVRYFPLAAWFLSWMATILVIVINAGGTTVIGGQHPALNTVMLSKTPILSVRGKKSTEIHS